MLKFLLPLLCLTPGIFATDLLLRVPNSALNRQMIQKLDLDIGCKGTSRDYLELIVDDHARRLFKKHGRFKKSLFSQGKVINSDLQEQYRSFWGKKDLGIYHTFAEMEAELKKAATDYPGLARLFIAGRTFEGRPIYALEVGNPASSVEKKAFLVMGTHHAREWISTEVPLASIQDLLSSYATDLEARKILDSSTLVYVPMLNVDGGIHSRKEKKMWRKNRRVNLSGGTGVDNNRNYDYKWGVSGSSSYGSSNVFHGPKPMSESENQTVKNLQETYGFVGSISFHSYSELVLWPWGYTTNVKAKDHDDLKQIGEGMGEIMDYEPMQSALLYPAAGDSDDYLYARYGVAAYTIELGRRFVPRALRVKKINKNGAKALRYFFLNARDPFPGQSQDPVYRAASNLESLVAGLEDGLKSPSEQGALKTLLHFSDGEIDQAMDRLDMNVSIRLRLLRELRRARIFGSLYQ
jgi:carboxypeptidase T